MARFAKLRSLDVDAVMGGAGDVGAAVLIQAPGVGKKIVVHGYGLTMSAAAVAKFRTGAGGTGTSLWSVRASAAGQGMAERVARPEWIFSGGENEAIYLNVSAAATISGGVTYSIVNSTEE